MSDDDVVRVSALAQGLPGVGMEVGRVRAWERLNAPYQVSIALTLEDPDADPAAMLGKGLELEVVRGEVARRFVGLVSEVALESLVGERNVRWHEVKVVPALALLAHRRDTRIFQEKTALEIVQAVLEEALSPFQRTVEVLCSATYPTREYCVQYQESDLDFVHRLLEEEGIGYLFSHEGEREVLTLFDASAQLEKASTITGDGIARYRDDLRPHDGFDVVREVVRARRSTTTSVAVRDYDFTGQTVEGEERGEDELGRDRERYEHGLGRSLTIGDYAGTAYGAHDAARQALLRREMHLAGAALFRGTGDALGFAAGRTFTLTDHPLLGVDGDYLLTEVEQRWNDADARRERARAAVRFVAQPLATPYRPERRTPKPFVAGLETAIVTGPAGEEIHTDEHGRIKVQFHWDRDGRGDDKTSCFIRVRQAWAGEGWGFVFLPRIGMEVVVSFVGGDPDRPVAEGCVYDGDHRPPYALPDEKTKSTIKTQSSTGAPDGYNELRFEDAAGAEQIFTHAQKDQNEIVLNDHTTHVGGDQSNTVGETQTQKVHQSQTEKVHGTQDMTVGSDRTVHVVGSFTETIDAGEKVTIGAGVTETITSFETRSVAGGLTDEITDGELRVVGGGVQEDVTGTHDQHVLGPNAEILLAGSTQTVTAGPVTFETAGTHTLTSGGAIAFNGMAGIKKYATQITQTTDLDFHFDPDLVSNKWTTTSTVGTSISVTGDKKALTGVAAAAGILKLSIFGTSAGVAGLKVTATGVKIDLYAKKEELAGAKASPAKVEVSTN